MKEFQGKPKAYYGYVRRKQKVEFSNLIEVYPNTIKKQVKF